MKKSVIILSAVLSMALGACTHENEPLQAGEDNFNVEKLSNAEAQKAFAKLLSNAVTNSMEVRAFLKDEALAMFDNDTDVFYPFVKDKEVCNGKTFRDILLSYCEREEDLVQIEESLLLLNILVPDLTLFWDFDAEKWDVSDDEIAVISRDDDESTLYAGGEELGFLPLDEVPGFPCLVVKNNERMKVSNRATRAGEAVYAFANDAFDPSKNPTQTRDKDDYWDKALEGAEETRPYVKASELDPLVVQAYNEFPTIDNRQYQRDYVYYGIGRSNQPGTLRTHVFEEILRFRLDANCFKIIADDDMDSKLQNPGSAGKGNAPSSAEEILRRVWTDGIFELSLVFMEDTAAPIAKEFLFAVKGKDLFSLAKARVHYRHKTWFRKHEYNYSVNVDDLTAKWVNPRALPGLIDASPVLCSAWDLYEKSMKIGVLAYERDGGEPVVVTHVVSNEFADKADFRIDSDSRGRVQVKLGYGFSPTTKSTSIFRIMINKETDELGKLTLNYKYPIILSDTEKDTKGYRMYAVDSGGIEVVFAPKRPGVL